MAQFDVHRNPEPATRGRVPYVVDLQSDLLADLPTRLVAPLRLRDATMKAAPRRLCPSFDVQGVEVVMYPHEMAGIPARLLGRPVASLRASSAVLVDAVDAVLSGP
ncbi:MAG: CcdB family protein [Burkholderiaceae bacterium]|jgi:toxin CcdB|nr:CcdB family protein [Burkholderiales bacterium]MCZ8107881.1 CcdB family protein [Burkholderiales bacterium]MCZ8340463.1 CcdB family protein [Burkholderiaceae bacterium]